MPIIPVAAAIVLISQIAPPLRLANFEVVRPPAASAVTTPQDGLRNSRSLEKPQRASHAHFFEARGYGHQVPLGFAVRQIVPRGVSISFRGDVDRRCLVDWVGGRGWNKVLATTVAICGDKIDVGHNTVAVLKKKDTRSHDDL